jgi:hypothetical protein
MVTERRTVGKPLATDGSRSKPISPKVILINPNYHNKSVSYSEKCQPTNERCLYLGVIGWIRKPLNHFSMNTKQFIQLPNCKGVEIIPQEKIIFISSDDKSLNITLDDNVKKQYAVPLTRQKSY